MIKISLNLKTQQFMARDIAHPKKVGYGITIERAKTNLQKL
ncbi:hypothetical protein ACFFIF_02225 [Vagococcus entomophilus]|nr:hypothetical protein [Vagococcus entomophilus]